MFSREEAEASQLIKDGTTEIQKLCLGGCCSRNCISNCRLGKKLAKKVEDLNNLRSKRLFDMVADRLPPASVDERPSEPTVGMISTFNKVWSCLGEEQVGIIGLCGMGGVGKITLLTQINNEFLKTNHDFDVVIWAEEWKYAIKVLQRGASIFPGTGDRMFPILKSSFDSLPSNAIKSCFLYCSLFPGDFNILKENLVDYWIGEGFLHEFDNIDGDRNQGHDIFWYSS